MPSFAEPKGPHAHLARKERDQSAPVPVSKPAPATASPDQGPGPRRNSERDPKWFKRMHQLSGRCEENWPGRGHYQIQMGSNLWSRLADASAKTPDEIWEHALDRLAEMQQRRRAICTSRGAMLARSVDDRPRHVKQRLADESIPMLVPTPGRPWVEQSEAILAEKVKRALASASAAAMTKPK